MKGFLKHIGLLMFVFLGIILVISIGSLWSLRNSSFYKPSFLANEITPKNFDYIILGSSVGLTTLDTKLVDSINGTNGLNLAMDDTGMSGHYLMLQHFVAEGKKTKYCILAPGLASLENKRASSGDNDYRFLMFVNRDYVYDYFENASPGTTATCVMGSSRWFPFVGVSYYNTEIFFPSIVTLFQPKKHNRFDARGNYTYPKRNKKFKDKETKTQKLTFEHPYLKKIEKLCTDNNIQLIYYFSPMRGQKIEYKIPDFRTIDHTEIVKDDADFYDDIHVNNVGRKKVSKVFAEDFLSLGLIR